MLLEERISGQTGLLLRSADFLDDGLCGGAWIGCGEDRATHDEEIRAGADRFGWRCGTRLIVVL